MGLNWNKKYTTIAAYALIVIFFSVIFLGAVIRIEDFKAKLVEFFSAFLPFIIGAVMAYLLNFVLVFYEKLIFRLRSIKLSQKRLIRGLAIFLTYMTMGLIGYSFIRFISPQLSKGVTNFVDEFPDYIAELTEFINTWLERFNLAPSHISYMNEQLAKIIEKLFQFMKNIVPVLLENTILLASSIWNIALGVVISVYLLSDKERFLALSKKLVYAIFNQQYSSIILKLTKRADEVFGRFLIGTIIDAIIVGVLTLVLLFIFKIPYAFLIAFIVGVSNIIPFFGPFIGAVPSAIIIFFVSPLKALWFLVIILVIQQVDGNIIAPKILGESIGLSPFWVLFSTLIFGNLFGIIGIVIGVPVFAFIHSIAKEVLELRLARKSLPIDTNEYI